MNTVVSDRVAEFLKSCWAKGQLKALCRLDGQTRLYDSFHAGLEQRPDNVIPHVWKCHRRMGKSVMGLILCLEACYAAPRRRAVFGAPTYKQVQSIAVPNMNTLLRTCPENLRPVPVGQSWKIPNLESYERDWSRLDLVGCNVDNGDRLRGSGLNVCVLDECREIPNLRYLIEDIIVYQFVGQDFPALVLLSTMPPTADHAFNGYFAEKSRSADRYMEVKGSGNLDFTEQDRDIVRNTIGGGEDSLSWLREVECITIPDADRAVLPEFYPHKDQVVCEWPRPSHFFPHTCLDTGWLDWNAALHGYVDFKRDVIVIEAETVMRYKSTGDIAGEIFRKEKALWGSKDDEKVWIGGHKPTRMGDLKQQGLEDLRTDYKMLIEPVDKYDKKASINNVRTGIQLGKLKIHPRCTHLVNQCMNGMLNEQRTDFERSEDMGHLDALAALIYLYKMARWNGNPFPDKQIVDLDFMDTSRAKWRTPKNMDAYVKAFTA